MPMCSVMQDGKYLTWGSSARTGLNKANQKLARKSSVRPQRYFEEMTRTINEKVGPQDLHTTRWSCAEQNCQNTIARETAMQTISTGDKTPLSETPANDYVHTKYRSLSLMSKGWFDAKSALGSLEWVEQKLESREGCEAHSTVQYGCGQTFRKLNVVDLALPAKTVMQMTLDDCKSKIGGDD